MRVAITVAQRSKCINRQVGAVIVDKHNRPIAVGYNGPPANFKAAGSCKEFCERGGSENRSASYSNCVSVHAEANALLFADRREYEGGTIYVTSPCCFECAKLVSNSGLARVYMQVSTIDAHASWDHIINFFQDSMLQVVISERESNAI